jgi:hypothetical protein
MSHAPSSSLDESPSPSRLSLLLSLLLLEKICFGVIGRGVSLGVVLCSGVAVILAVTKPSVDEDGTDSNGEMMG